MGFPWRSKIFAVFLVGFLGDIVLSPLFSLG
jgi:hypothetical protein